MGVFLLAGAAGLPAQVQAPQALAAGIFPSYTLTMTGYNAVPGQTDDTPYETAAGTYTNPQTVAAISQDLVGQLPFGTIIEVQGPGREDGWCNDKTVADHIGYRVIADTMNIRLHNRVDILFSTKDDYLLPNGRTMNAASLLGACAGTTVRVVGFVDISNPNNLPRTQADLVAIVEHKNLAAR